MTRITALFLAFLISGPAVADEMPRTITVSGQGTAQATPDRAIVTLSIVARNQSVSAAQEEAADVVARVQALADELDIPENRVDTMSASVYPDYRFNQATQEQEIRGYIAQRQMRIEIHDLDSVGVVVERAIEEGVNQVTPPQLISSRQRDAYRAALENAIADARANAERLASALGVAVGSVIQVSDGAPTGPGVPFMGARQADVRFAEAVAMPETYNAGDMTVSASVNVVYALAE